MLLKVKTSEKKMSREVESKLQTLRNYLQKDIPDKEL